MSRQFKAVAIFVTTSPATDVDHDGKPITRDDIPVGSIIAQDATGDCFIDTNSFIHGIPTSDADDWREMAKMERGTEWQLFRDHWQFLIGPNDIKAKHDRVSPYNRCIRSASKELLWGTPVIQL